MYKYIILRDSNQRLRRPTAFGPSGAIVRPSLETLAVPPDPMVETAELTATEAHDSQRDPSILAMARAMPLKLIEPVAGPEPAAAAAPTWGVTAVGAVASPFSGAGVRVAILDTGIDAAHPAFQGVNLIQQDFSGSGNGDGHGHGTHCAGTVFGRDVAGTRIGVARGVTEALIGRVLGSDGSGSSEMLFDALKWASSNNAKVISMSLGFDFPGLVDDLVNKQNVPAILAGSMALEAYRMNLRVFDQLMGMMRALAEFNGGVVVVAASGNESERQIDPNFEVSASLPAAAEGVVSVGALREDPAGLKVADFSNTNPILSAPGVGVISAKKGGGLRSMNGTSMACPHVAGVAALWWEALASAGVPLTNRAVEARMLASAIRSPFAPGADVADRGQGLAQAPSAAIS
jgi:subtilisin family serine protease